jgi:hypothetical protein
MQCFACPCGYNNLVLRIGEAVFLPEFLRNSIPQLFDPGVTRVAGLTFSNCLNGRFFDMDRGIEIRLSQSEVDGILSCRFEQFPYP